MENDWENFGIRYSRLHLLCAAPGYLPVNNDLYRLVAHLHRYGNT